MFRLHKKNVLRSEEWYSRSKKRNYRFMYFVLNIYKNKNKNRKMSNKSMKHIEIDKYKYYRNDIINVEDTS